MTAWHWIQIVALSSALGLAGAAIAQNTEGKTSTEDFAGLTNPGAETPSAGALVTPEDKAFGMGKDHGRNGVRNRAFDENAPKSDDEERSANPGSSKSDEPSETSGPSRAPAVRTQPRAAQAAWWDRCAGRR